MPATSGNKAIHLGVDRNINATPNQYLSTSPVRDQATINALSATVPNPFFGINPIYPKTITVADLLRPYPEFGDITETQPLGYSWYHALQARVEKRFAHNYMLGASYTFSKNMEATSFLNAGDPACEPLDRRAGSPTSPQPSEHRGTDRRVETGPDLSGGSPAAGR